MNNRTDHGFLILADVSGFTAFVTTTELEHGSEIIAALLDEVVGHLSPPLEIQEIEGDAVFALGGETSPLPKTRLLRSWKVPLPPSRRGSGRCRTSRPVTAERVSRSRRSI